MKRFISIGLLCFILGVMSAYSQKQPTDSLAQAVCTASDSSLLAYLKENGVGTTSRNEVKLLPSGREKFEVLFEDIEQARHHIHLEYFNFRNDSIAALLFELLARKAAEGIKVRAMFDDFGNMSNNRPLKKRHLKEIREKGIDIVRFDRIRFPYIHNVWHRDHRKIVVIDGRIGYTGGMNIADYYIDGLPEIGPWRDMHLRVRGESVADLQRIFLTMWNKHAGSGIPEEEPELFPVWTDSLCLDSQQIAIVDRVPRKLPKLLRRTFVKSIDSACDSIFIVNPYFLPTTSIRSALKRALKRGVKVELMIPAKADIPFTPEGSTYVAHKLMKHGVDVYMFNGGFHHSKVMLIDGTYCTVGSANLNSRSLRYDYEINAFIFNKETTDELNAIFREDKKESTYLTPEVWKGISRWKRFVGWFANLLTPFM